MSNGTPAHSDGTVDIARWLFPLERAPPPRDEGCKHNGLGDPAPQASNGSPPTPSPPSKSSRPTSFPSLVSMGGIAPADACPPPAILTEWRFYSSHEGSDGSFMVNLRSGERLGNHRRRFGIMTHGILNQSQIPRALGTVSQDATDIWILSHVGSIFQRPIVGTWLRTRFNR